MVNFKFVISEPETRKSFQKEVEQGQAAGIVGKKIGEEVSGDVLGLAGYTLKLTGGTDKDGFPMHPELKGPVRKKLLLTGPPGFYPKKAGERKRRTVRGDTISEDIVQVNVKVMKKGEKSLEELGFKTKEKPKEQKAEAVKEQPKEEKKQEAQKVESKQEEKKEETKKEENKTEVKQEEKAPEVK